MKAIPAPWYHGRISRADAEQSLSSTPHDCFLIRESEAEPGAFSISLKHEGQPRHFLIRRLAGQYEVTGTEDRFPDLSSLVAHYSEHPLSVGGEKLTRTCHMTPDTFTLPLQGIYIVLAGFHTEGLWNLPPYIYIYIHACIVIQKRRERDALCSWES